MKKLILCLFLFVSLSCTDNTSFDWAFTLTQTTSMSPSVSGYPKTISSTTFQNGLTTKEADDVVNKLNTKSVTTTGGYTVTIDQKCVKCLKSQYKEVTTTTTTNSY